MSANWRLRLLVATTLCITNLMLGTDTSTFAQNKKKLSRADRQRVLKCRQVVFGSQLPSGAIVAVRYLQAGRPAFVDSYFSALTCQCMLAVHAELPDRRTRKFIEKWLEWTARSMANNPHGVPVRLNGKLNSRLDLAAGFQIEKPDSHDSYAALYLAVAGRYAATFRVKPNARLITAVNHCVKVLERCHDPNNGLYFNFMQKKGVPPSSDSAHYLLDNVEVYQGLVGAVEFYEAAGDKKQAALVRTTASNLANSMHKFWSAKHQYFVVMANDVPYDVGWGVQPFYAFALGVVTGLSHLDNVQPKTKSALWTRFIKDFRGKLDGQLNAANFVKEDPTVERVFLATLRSAPAKQQSAMLEQLRKRTNLFLSRLAQLKRQPRLQFPYSHRLAHLMVGLLAQSQPSVFENIPTIPLDKNLAP